jgi:hypothetical protein
VKILNEKVNKGQAIFETPRIVWKLLTKTEWDDTIKMQM